MEEFLKLPKEDHLFRYEGNHLKVLFAIGLHFCYWKDNSITNINVRKLAKICLKSERRIYESLKYLRRHKLMFKIGDKEYINPHICFRSKEKQKNDLIRYIIEKRGKSLHDVSKVESVIYDFSCVSPAREEPVQETKVENSNLTIKNRRSVSKSYYEISDDNDDEDYDYDDDEFYEDDAEEEPYFK